MDAESYEEISGSLHGLLIRLMDRLPGHEVVRVSQFIDHNELGLALEQIAGVLSEEELPISADERADMLALAERMQLGAGWRELSTAARPASSSRIRAQSAATRLTCELWLLEQSRVSRVQSPDGTLQAYLASAIARRSG